MVFVDDHPAVRLSLLLTFHVTQVGFLQRIFGTAALTLGQWLVCIGVAAVLVVVNEVIKFILRHKRSAVDDRSLAASPATVDRHVESRSVDSAGNIAAAHVA
jgi:P-type Ca2+ transporter type 2C